MSPVFPDYRGLRGRSRGENRRLTLVASSVVRLGHRAVVERLVEDVLGNAAFLGNFTQATGGTRRLP